MEASHYLTDSFQYVCIISSLSFMLMVSFEQLSGTWVACALSSYSYKPLSLEDLDNDLNNCERSNLEIASLGDDDEKYKYESGNEEKSGTPNRYFPSSFLLVASVYCLVDAFVVGSKVHLHYGSLERLFSEKVLLSYTFGHFLEFLASPSGYKLYFIGIFSFSSPIGILLGQYLAIDQALVHTMYGFVTALCSGVILYLASNHILPAESLHSSRCSIHPCLKIFVLFTGFAIAAIPSFYVGYG